jgi:hypothetical protein
MFETTSPHRAAPRVPPDDHSPDRISMRTLWHLSALLVLALVSTGCR